MRRGFTLLEILIVIAVLFIVVVALVAAFSSFTKGQALAGGANTVLSLLKDARARTLASTNDTQYGVHLATGSATLFSGATYSAGASENIVATLDPRVEISDIALTGGGSDVLFERLTGATEESGTVELSFPSDPLTPTKTITIYASGLAELP